MKHAIIRSGFAAIGWSGIPALARPYAGGIGVILTFHHVRPWRPRQYAPNRELEITPEFFDAVLQLLKKRDFKVVTLDQAVEHLHSGAGNGQKIAVLTFDDGYRDNLEWALPILKREKMPMTLFVTTGFAARKARLWWVEVEEAVGRAQRIELRLPSGIRRFETASTAEKERAAGEILALLRATPQADLDGCVDRLSREHGIDPRALVEELCLDWDGIRAMAAEPMVTIGAHTVSHPMLAKVPEERALCELTQARTVIAHKIGFEPRHVAYPVGDPGSAGAREFALAADAGYVSGVTTRPGILFAEHARHLLALPRISVNGRHQSIRDVDLLLSGVPTLLWNRLRRLNVA